VDKRRHVEIVNEAGDASLCLKEGCPSQSIGDGFGDDERRPDKFGGKMEQDGAQSLRGAQPFTGVAAVS